MSKTNKILIGLTTIEVILTAYHFYVQPQCEPCLPGWPCRPCISSEQIFALFAGVGVAIVAAVYLLYINLKQKKKDS
jgi:hypothetical protein